MKSDYDTLHELDLLDEANTQTTLKSIVDRLPPPMQAKWVEKVHEFDRQHVRPKFKHLVQFMEKQSKRVNLPVFQVTSFQYDNSKRTSNPGQRPPRPGAPPRSGFGPRIPGYLGEQTQLSLPQLEKSILHNRDHRGRDSEAVHTRGQG